MRQLAWTLVALGACSGTPPMPKGPPPEYEESPIPPASSAAPSSAPTVAGPPAPLPTVAPPVTSIGADAGH